MVQARRRRKGSSVISWVSRTERRSPPWPAGRAANEAVGSRDLAGDGKGKRKILRDQEENGTEPLLRLKLPCETTESQTVRHK